MKLPDRLKAKTRTLEYNGKDRIYITWAAHLRAYAVYSNIYGTSQSEDRIAQRGGFGAEELDLFYPEWRNHIVQ